MKYRIFSADYKLLWHGIPEQMPDRYHAQVYMLLAAMPTPVDRGHTTVLEGIGKVYPCVFSNEYEITLWQSAMTRS